MPNQIDKDGLQVNSLNENLSTLLNNFNTIYKSNINLDQNTPDAQLLNIFAQIITSNGELLQDINASFDPDQAVGVVLDQRVKLNGIKRREGKKTICNVNVTFNGSATLKGQDLYPIEECFTISDNSGNTLIPIETTTGVNEDVKQVQFVATQYGALNFAEGTVTKIATPIAGVASVSNLATNSYDIGSDEESDTQLRVRREVSATQKGYVGGVDSLKQAIYNISEDISYVGVEQNIGDSEDINGIPSKGIWIIINTPVTNDGETNKAIAEAIYKFRISGTPMRAGTADDSSSSSSSTENSDKSYTIIRKNEEPFTAYWSVAQQENIYCRVTCFVLDEPTPYNNIKEIISSTTTPQVREILSVTSIMSKLTEGIPNIVITSVELSTDDTNWSSFVQPDKNEYLRIPVENITVTEYE